MRSLEENRITFDGNTYEMTDEGSLTDGELHVPAESPFSEEVTLVYKPKRSINVDVPEGYELGNGEFEVGNTSHKLMVDSEELGYTNVYTLEEVR